LIEVNLNGRFTIFILIVVVILSLSSYYIGNRLITRFSWAQSHRGIVWLSLSLFIVLQFLGPFLYRVYPDQFNRLFIIQWLTYTSLGVFACMLLYTITADFSFGLWKKISDSGNSVDLERRGFLAVGAMVLGSSMIGFAQAVTKPKVYNVEIPIENLPEEFDGFKIAQITDLHVGPTIGRKYTQSVVEITNDLAPDLVALTGDFVDGSVELLRSALEPIAQLRARHGTYFVTGNHEYYWGVEQWLEEFRRLGARVLLNEHTVIRQNGHEFVLAGITDHAAGQILPSHKSDPQKSLDGAPEQAVKILLAHQPASYRKASEAGFHLQLSGHTHGGQFFPWSLIVAITQPFYKGLNRHKKMWIYVSRGAGYWGPPLRFTVPSEITLIKLRRKQSTQI
jgi:predicted MPP superfamily phosphohydrolase